MDQVSQVKKNFRMQQWKQRIIECQSSGMTVKSWCDLNQVKQATYYRYLKLLRQELCESLPIPAAEPEKAVTFKKLDVQSPVCNTQAAVIIHLSSASLEVQNGATQQTVEAVLLALKNIC